MTGFNDGFGSRYFVCVADSQIQLGRQAIMIRFAYAHRFPPCVNPRARKTKRWRALLCVGLLLCAGAAAAI